MHLSSKACIPAAQHVHSMHVQQSLRISSTACASAAEHACQKHSMHASVLARMPAPQHACQHHSMHQQQARVLESLNPNPQPPEERGVGNTLLVHCPHVLMILFTVQLRALLAVDHVVILQMLTGVIHWWLNTCQNVLLGAVSAATCVCCICMLFTSRLPFARQMWL